LKKITLLTFLLPFSLFAVDNFIIIDMKHKINEVELHINNNISHEKNNFTYYFNKRDNYKDIDLFDKNNYLNENYYYYTIKYNNNKFNILLKDKNINLENYKSIIFNSMMFEFLKLNKNMKKEEFNYIYNILVQSNDNSENIYIKELKKYLNKLVIDLKNSKNINKELKETAIYLNNNIDKLFINNLYLNKKYKIKNIGDNIEESKFNYTIEFKEDILQENKFYMYVDNNLPKLEDNNKEFIQNFIYKNLIKYPELFKIDRLYLYDKQINKFIQLMLKFSDKEINKSFNKFNNRKYKELNRWELLKSIIIFEYVNLRTNINNTKFINKLNIFKGFKLNLIKSNNIKLNNFYSKYYYTIKENKVLIITSIVKNHLNLSLLNKNDLKFDKNNELILDLETLKLISKNNIELY
jgi:hypothetical protein